MKRTVVWMVGAWLAVALATASTGGAATTDSTATSSESTGSSATAAAPAAPRTASTRSGAPAKASKRANAAPRTLEDIHIEGEVPMPQVLFVTAQDQRRFLESHHRHYLRTSLELGKATSMPERIRLTRSTAPPAGGAAR